jgi:hypothetical protein
MTKTRFGRSKSAAQMADFESLSGNPIASINQTAVSQEKNFERPS